MAYKNSDASPTQHTHESAAIHIHARSNGSAAHQSTTDQSTANQSTAD
jgi:hypothetical protein